VLADQRPGGRGAIARGAGLSYGDAAQNGGGTVLEMTALDRILSIDGERRTVTVQAGATLARVIAELARHGLTLPVVPGTRYVTVGGAIASDIHGKSHHRDGSLARHVAALSLCTASGEILELSPDCERDLFAATLGGMGLTGVVVQATLRVEPLTAPWVRDDVDRTEDFEQTLELMSGEDRHRWSVAWLDLLAGGRRRGRAVVSRANPWSGQAPPGPTAIPERPRVGVPRGVPGGLLRPSSVRAFNELRWRAAPRRERERPVALAPYLFPLDSVGGWNRLYGPAGLVQYQFVVPTGQEYALFRCVELLGMRRLPVYLAVFKRFGPASDGPLSFPLPGWTLAIDLPAGAPGLWHGLEELDDVVAGCGGRVYLTKDARLRRETLRAMYPELDRLHAQRALVDPDGVLHSDLTRRLGLCGESR